MRFRCGYQRGRRLQNICMKHGQRSLHLRFLSRKPKVGACPRLQRRPMDSNPADPGPFPTSPSLHVSSSLSLFYLLRASIPLLSLSLSLSLSRARARSFSLPPSLSVSRGEREKGEMKRKEEGEKRDKGERGEKTLLKVREERRQEEGGR